MNRKEPRACINCGKTYWSAKPLDLRCRLCEHRLQNRKRSLAAKKRKRVRQGSRAKPRRKSEIERTIYDCRRNREPDVVTDDGTLIWYFSPIEARTMGKHYDEGSSR